MNQSAIRRTIAVLMLSRSFKVVGDEVSAIITACAAYISINWSPGLLDAAKTAYKNFDDAQKDMEIGGKGKKAIRDEAWMVLYLYLVNIQSDLQKYADQNPASAESAITSCLFKVKKQAIKQKQVDAVKTTNVQGTVALFGKVEKGDQQHGWSMSTDNINFSLLPTTVQAKTTVSGLPSATVVYFKHRGITKDGPREWGTALSIILM